MSTVGLTQRQLSTYQFICRYAADHRTTPTYDEICARMGFGSKSQAYEVVHALVERGVIELLPGKARGIILKKGMPLAGSLTIPFPHDVWIKLHDYAEKDKISPVTAVVEAVRNHVGAV